MPHDPLAWITDELTSLNEAHLLRRQMARHGAQSASRIEADGHCWINFSSNDYLGLASHELLAAARTALEAAGWGSGASPLVTGRSHIHAELERQLAEFEQTEAALLFPSGYAANSGTIAALVGAEDCIYSDAKNHASIIDGCRLARAAVQVYPHRDVDTLRKCLEGGSHFRRRLIVTDTLFSMDGDFAPLAELAELAEKHRAMLLVDEAHATGVFGANGRGLSEALGSEAGVHVRIGTLSKALGSAGGFVAGSGELIQWLANRARSYVFSTAPPAACAAAAIEALRIVRQQPARRASLLQAADSVVATLGEQGWQLGDQVSQIVPIYLGEAGETMRIAALLRERGLLVSGIRPPTVPPGESMLRISLSWAHTAEDRAALLAALAEIKAAL
jgi:8-amino-7-oxononanoate synthase